MPSRAALIAAVALPVALLSGVSREARAAWSHQSGVNTVICSATDTQSGMVMVPDGAGGAYVAWQDARSGNYDIYLQHMTIEGVDPAWPANGLAVCTDASNQIEPAMVSDGAGGVIVSWSDQRSGLADIYAQHVLASGLVDGTWPAQGAAVCTAIGQQSFSSIVSDGAGGAIVGWADLRGGVDFDVYAQRVLASGAVDPGWPFDGRALCTSIGQQVSVKAVSDGAGGALVVWQDLRAGAFDIYAQRVDATGTVHAFWPANGVALCTAANSQEFPKPVPDGAGGAVVAWQDFRAGGGYDIYAHHVLATGTVDSNWPVDGRAVCALGGYQWQLNAITDDAGGMIVTWEDTRIGAPDIYAHHVLATGVLDPAWPVDGRVVCGATGSQLGPVVAADGGGGAFVAWYDERISAFNRDIYAQHVTSNGAIDPYWPADGRAVCTAAGLQQLPVIAADASGGFVVVWQDQRAGEYDLLAQRVARYGVLGTPEPVIASVRDVPNDQGGLVKVSWDASWLDTDPSAVVDHYWIFRSVPTAQAEALLRAGGGRTATLGSALARPGQLVALPGTNTTYWEYVANQPAYHFLSGYSMVAATTGDSTGDYNPPTQFMVVAWNLAGTQYWASLAASGYSVDNLPPAAPALLGGNYASGSTHLHWEPNAEGDFAEYRIYRGGSADFVPSPANRIAAAPDTGYADPGPAGSYYKISAVDLHGNESGFALLTPIATLAVAPGTRDFGLAGPTPNPSTGPVSFAVTLPATGPASLAILDAAGRRVRGLLAGDVAAGTRTAVWDGRDDSGQAVAPGLYFARLEAAGHVRILRTVRVR